MCFIITATLSLAFAAGCGEVPFTWGPYEYTAMPDGELQDQLMMAASIINEEAGCGLIRVYDHTDPKILNVELVAEHDNGADILGCAHIGESFRRYPTHPIQISQLALDAGGESLLLTVTHEVGHTVGLEHDEPYEDTIMSSIKSLSFEWSEASSRQLRGLCNIID